MPPDGGKPSQSQSKQPDGILPSPNTGQNAVSGSGLSVQEALALVWPKAQKTFSDPVLWRMVPSSERKGTLTLLEKEWRSSGRSEAWTIWYADSEGENWLIFRVEGSSLTGTDIGTRSFSSMTMPKEWPRKILPVSLEEAAQAAARQGADLDGLQWLEYTVDSELGGPEGQGCWIFSCATSLDTGSSLQYRMFVDAVTGEVMKAINLRGEEMALPIDLNALAEVRDETHQSDLEKFLGHLGTEDVFWTIHQMSSRLCPDDAAGRLWLEAFSSRETAEVLSIEAIRLEEWTRDWEAYKVVLRVETAEPPERFGWENGENTRWVTLVPQGAGGWKVDEWSANP